MEIFNSFLPPPLLKTFLVVKISQETHIMPRNFQDHWPNLWGGGGGGWTHTDRHREIWHLYVLAQKIALQAVFQPTFGGL